MFPPHEQEHCPLIIACYREGSHVWTHLHVDATCMSSVYVQMVHNMILLYLYLLEKMGGNIRQLAYFMLCIW